MSTTCSIMKGSIFTVVLCSCKISQVQSVEYMGPPLELHFLDLLNHFSTTHSLENLSTKQFLTF